MKPFLQRIAEEIVSRFGDDPNSMCVVLPNRRAGLYLRKYLAAALEKTAWAPETYSIEDFITTISGFKIIDKAGLLFELYAVHKELNGETAQDFELFADWGEVLLKDFDEIDQYLVDPAKIFTFIDEARALSVWNLGEKPLTEHEKQYIRFYQSFKTYYEILHARLLAKGHVYRGLAYRHSAENISKLSSGLRWKKIFFAGLNALAKAEEHIIDYLLKNGQAEIYWDADEYYIRDSSQEAGTFIRDYLKKWPSNPVKWLERAFMDSEKTIQIFGIPGGTGQAIKAGQILRELGQSEAEPDKTALVLADESLLIPVLYALPEETGPVNVTMGFPFRYTNLYQLVYLMFRLQENIDRFSSRDAGGPEKLYAKDLMNLLNHPYLSLWLDEAAKSNDPDALSDLLRKKNRVFLNPKEIGALIPQYDDEFRDLLNHLLIHWTSPEHAIGQILDVMDKLKSRMDERSADKYADHELDMEYLYHFSKVVRRCRTLMDDYPFFRDIESLRKIMFQIMDLSRLPFYGEPLKGMQVMGVLETRAIDFENLIVLNANEGILPSGKTSNSFIPFDIKQTFGLPTFQQKDNVFAYHFYRMIQRARNIYLLYDTEGDAMKGGEKSRYIMQIACELPKINEGIHITESLLSPNPPSTGASALISMPRTTRIMKVLHEKAARGFSPSALNLYILCPLRFYFQEILGISEADELEETIEAKTMGTVIHKVLFQIYEPFLNGHVEPQKLSARASHIEEYLQEAFREYYSEGDLEHGKNQIVYKVSLFLIKDLVKQEMALLEHADKSSGALKILHLEEKLEAFLDCKSGKDLIRVKVKGLADRIDRFNNTIRIIDYKTGAVRPEELKVKSWESLTHDAKMGKAFQLLMYAYLFSRQVSIDQSALLSGNISLRKISEYVMQVRLPEEQEIHAESMKRFEEELVRLLEEIMDPDRSFDQTEDPENCTYCPFRAVCCR